jgi:hypothetical protein
MVLEGGLEPAVPAFVPGQSHPVLQPLRKNQEIFFARACREMTPLLKEGKVIGNLTSNIIWDLLKTERLAPPRL